MPLRLAWAITIYKVQGMTLPICRVNLGDSEKSYGTTNVAISRTRRLQDLFFDPFDLDRITKKIQKPPELHAFLLKTEQLFEETKEDYFQS